MAKRLHTLQADGYKEAVAAAEGGQNAGARRQPSSARSSQLVPAGAAPPPLPAACFTEAPGRQPPGRQLCPGLACTCWRTVLHPRWARPAPHPTPLLPRRGTAPEAAVEEEPHRDNVPALVGRGRVGWGWGKGSRARWHRAGAPAGCRALHLRLPTGRFTPGSLPPPPQVAPQGRRLPPVAHHGAGAGQPVGPGPGGTRTPRCRALAGAARRPFERPVLKSCWARMVIGRIGQHAVKTSPGASRRSADVPCLPTPGCCPRRRCLCRVWPEDDEDEVLAFFSLVHHCTGEPCPLPAPTFCAVSCHGGWQR